MVPAGCDRPSAPAAPASPAIVRRELVGVWAQCGGVSIFGAGTGAAVQIFATGTWRLLAPTPGGGWEPLQGPYDSGTWQLMPAPASVAAERVGLVRFAASAPSTVSAPSTKTWTVRVMVTSGRPVRGQFVDGSTVANYRLLPASTAAAASGPG
jgi:hypothetical protein